jgi:hypothetical protein
MDGRMIYIIEFSLLAFSVFFSIGMAITMVIWISIGLTNLFDNIEKRVKARRNKKYQQILRGIGIKEIKLDSNIPRVK